MAKKKTSRKAKAKTSGSGKKKTSRKAKAKTSGSVKKSYWDEYSNLQAVKHKLIRNYLGGWFPKLVLGGSKRVLFIDTHAGRGRHLQGELGSPLVALETLLTHSHRDSILSKGEVVFNFIERDQKNLQSLESELIAYHPLPNNVCVHPLEGDSTELINGLINYLDEEGYKLAPSFVFCDPFGFTISGSLLRRLMNFNGVELFINVIWRELDMAMAQGRKEKIKPGMKKRLDSIFDGLNWLAAVDSNDYDERADQCVNLFRKLTGAQWATYIRMVDKNKTRYFLLHLTNHPAGRDLMKGCIWTVCPDGGYYARKSDDPKQQMLITPNSLLIFWF